MDALATSSRSAINLGVHRLPCARGGGIESVTSFHSSPRSPQSLEQITGSKRLMLRRRLHQSLSPNCPVVGSLVPHSRRVGCETSTGDGRRLDASSSCARRRLLRGPDIEVHLEQVTRIVVR